MSKVYRVDKFQELEAAGPGDLVELNKGTASHSIIVPKLLLVFLISAITRGKRIHLSGPTGTAKTTLIEAIADESNFQPLCRLISKTRPEFVVKPLKVFPVEMAIFEDPGGMISRRSIRDGNTYDEPSVLMKALREAADSKAAAYPLIWLREMGRVHSADVMGGLLDIVVDGPIQPVTYIEPIDGRGLAWIADSNYQVGDEATHTLVTLDDAVRRRFEVALTQDYLSPSQESDVMRHIVKQMHLGVKSELVDQVVKLGSIIRNKRKAGTLRSLAPPTIGAYKAFLEMSQDQQGVSPQDIARSTLLGHASTEDEKLLPAVTAELWGAQAVNEEDAAEMGGVKY